MNDLLKTQLLPPPFLLCLQRLLSIDVAASVPSWLSGNRWFLGHRNSWNEIQVLQCLNLNLRTETVFSVPSLSP